MGKTSRIRNRPEKETRASYADGTRKLFDVDAMPEGCNPDIWHLTKLFMQKSEEIGETPKGAPIVYTVLTDRLNKSGLRAETLTPRVRACISDTTGRPYDWVDIVEDMITTFFDGYSDSYSLDYFCSMEVFEWLLDGVIATKERQQLRSNSTLVPERPTVVQKARDPDVARDIIMKRKYTEEELDNKMREFRNR